MHVLIHKNPSFIDMGRVRSTIVSTAEILRASCTQPLTLSNSNGNIRFGQYVTVGEADVAQWRSWHGNLYFQGARNEKVNTVITIEGSGTIKMPTIWVNGQQVNDGGETYADGTNIIWYLPDASRVELGNAPWLGHIIAPNATITMASGNYNGCLIGRSLIIGAEGHLYNYTAGKLPKPDTQPTPTPTPVPTPEPTPTPTPVPTPTPTPVPPESYSLKLKVRGNIVEENMPQDMPWSFTYALRPVTEDAPMPADAQDGVALATVCSSDPADEPVACFSEITYTEEGEFVYALSEVDDTQDYFRSSSETFTITVDVTLHEGNELDAAVSYSLEGEPVDELQFETYFLEHEWNEDMAPVRGSIRLNLIDAETQQPLTGTVFSVYYDPGCSRFYTSMPETDQNGESILPDVDPGTYFVRERTPSPGYGMDPNVFEVQVEPGKDAQVNDGTPIANLPGGGSIILTNAVENTITGEDFPFTIALTGSDVSNVYVLHNGRLRPEIAQDLSDDGQAQAYLGHGDKLEIAALPMGTEYHIAELATALPYMVSVNGEEIAAFSGTAEAGIPAQANFINTLELEAPTQSQIEALPKTGDDTQVLLWCALLAAASSALLILRRRRA